MRIFFDTEKRVKGILEQVSATRSDDWFLLVTYWHRYAPEGVSLMDFYRTPWKYKAPTHTCIERCRRKVQEKYPELKDEEAAKARKEERLKYEEYAITS